MNGFEKTSKQKVADIILKVIAGSKSVKDALLLFPEDKSISIQCAWHALAHYEADEDLRRKDPIFAKEQDEYLEMLAFLFQEDKDLPENVISSYLEYYKERVIYEKKKNIIQMLKSLFRFIT
ncbi:MAG: hypothetical protein PHV68_06130 [Candidatus Gastranaerophilales bacterium]|nr:hypothetical protein [Candidatus Gastranaerophilales bacterium]